jgi:hypothetical protein
VGRLLALILVYAAKFFLFKNGIDDQARYLNTTRDKNGYFKNYSRIFLDDFLMKIQWEGY